MSMMDFASALGGGGAPGGPPPGMDAGPPPDVGLPPDDAAGGQQFANSLDALDAAEDALKAFIDLDPDHADKAVAAQCLQNVLKLKAANQDSVASGDMKGLQRALQGGPAAVGGPGGAGY